MTMPNFSDYAYGRDMDLARGLSGSADHIRKDLRDWIQAELNALIATADAHAPLQQGIIGDQVRKLTPRLREINHNDLPEADGDCKAVIDQVHDGGYDDALDAHNRLRNGFDGLLRLVRELQQARNLIGTLAED